MDSTPPLPPASGPIPGRMPRSAEALAAEALGAEALAAELARGAAVLLPTDTLPALAAKPQAAAQIWELKDRPADKPLILMGADLDQLQENLGLSWREDWLEMARRSWPGAVTLVLPIQSGLTTALHPGGASLGLRVPACPITQNLLRLSGPLATTSVNRSGQPAACTAAQAAAQFPTLALLGPLPWPVGSGVASTVLAFTSQGHWRLVRSAAGMKASPDPL